MAHRSTRTRLIRAAIGWVALASVDCTTIDDSFSCTSDASCVRESAQGQCQPTGFCSFADVSCAKSGQRYSEHAGALSNACVEPGTGSSSGGGGAGGSYATRVLAAGPLAYWRLGDKGSTVVAVDASPNGHNATYQGGVTLEMQGAISGDDDTAARLDGNDDQIVAEGPFGFPMKAAFSLEAWVWPTADGGTLLQRLSETGGVQDGYSLQRDAGDILAFKRWAKGDPQDIARWQKPLPTDRFSYVVATFDEETVFLYVDAERDPDLGSDIAGNDLGDTVAEFRMGDGKVGSLAGSIDEVAVYGRALSEDEIAEHFAAAGSN